MDPSVGRDLEKQPLPGSGITLDTPEQILAAGDRIQAALNACPDLTALLFVNPALVLEDLGFKLTPAARHHVLDTLAQGGGVSRPLEKLDATLRKHLGEASAKLNFGNPAHTAKILFELLALPPLDTNGVPVPYRTGPLSDRFAELKKRAGKPTRVLRKLYTRPLHGFTLSFPEYRAQVRFIDVDAALPKLKTASARPDRVSTEELLFYRDAHPLVRTLLDYQVLWHTKLPFASGDTYRSIRDGKVGSVWRSWVRSVAYPDVKPKGR